MVLGINDTAARQKQNLQHQKTSVKRGSLVAAAALAVLSLTVVALPGLVWYLYSRSFSHLLLNDLGKKVDRELQHKLGDSIDPLTITKTALCFQRTFGKRVSNSQELVNLRQTKKQLELSHTLTPVMLKEKGIVDGLLIHDTKTLGKGAFSTVKKGWLVRHSSEGIGLEEVAIHKGQKNGEYRTTIEDRKFRGIKEGPYQSEVKQLIDYFKNELPPNFENLPYALGWLDAKREFMVHALRQGDLEHVPIKKSSQLLIIARDLANGLEHFHKNEIIFRDLKPANVLIDKDNKALLSDPMPVKENEADGFVGTPMYTPNKEARNQTRQSDLYALGLTLLDAKYYFLKNKIDSYAGSHPVYPFMKECIENTISNTKSVAKKAGDIEKLGLVELWKQADQLQPLRLLNRDLQDYMIDTMVKLDLFPDENAFSIKANLAYLDEIIRKLIILKPEDRLSAKNVSKELSIASVKVIRSYMRAENEKLLRALCKKSIYTKSLKGAAA